MLVSFEEARAHLRVDDCYPTEQIAPYLHGAERDAATFLNRALFESEKSLLEAIAAVPKVLSEARIAHDLAMKVAMEHSDFVVRTMATEHVTRVYKDAQREARETLVGMVANEAIKAAILLILGHLHENREDVLTGTTATALPNGAKALLYPYRVGLGV